MIFEGDSDASCSMEGVGRVDKAQYSVTDIVDIRLRKPTPDTSPKKSKKNHSSRRQKALTESGAMANGKKFEFKVLM